MDSLTQIAIGAATGEAVLGKKLGNKAVMWGAVAGTISDLDVIPGMLFDDPGRLLFHRGFSHSLAFVLIATPVFSWLFSRFYRDRNVSYREWATYFGIIFFFSIFLDAFTTYGTQLLWPLKYRFEFNTIFVVDPLFTLPLIISTVWLMFKKRDLPSRAVINKTGLAISAVYLMFTVVNKQMINRVFESSLADQNISYQNMITNPGPANQVLWTAVVETDDRFLTGYYSHFDDDKKIRFEVAPKNHHLLTPLENFPQVKKILRFTKGYYTVEKSGQGFLINDLRFGKIANWQTGEGQYVFRYRVKVEKGKVIVEEAEKTFDISADLLQQLWKRINGKKDFTQ